MARRVYVLPLVDTINGRWPKYFADNQDIRIDWFPFGGQYTAIASCLVGSDITPSQHDRLTSISDVVAFPEDLDQNITTSAIAAVSSVLEYLGLPFSWVTTSHSYRVVFRRLLAIVFFMQSYFWLSGKQLYLPGIDLDTQWSALPADVKADIQTIADEYGLDYSTVTGTTPLRSVLLLIAQQWPVPYDWPTRE